jgi:hypothetical protein
METRIYGGLQNDVHGIGEASILEAAWQELAEVP